MTGYSRLARSIVLFAAATLLSAQPAFSQTKKVTVSLASESLAAALPRLAKEMGFFAKHGLDPTFIAMESGAVSTAALISGSAQFTVAGPGEVIAAQARGQKVVTVVTCYVGQSATLVLAKSVADKLGVSPTAPINERLKALDGLVVAGTSPTSAPVISYKGAAEAVGANMRLTYMTLGAMPGALETGVLQGYFASAPAWIVPIVKGTGIVWIAGGPSSELPAKLNPVTASMVLTTRDYAQANPDVLKSFVNAISDVRTTFDQRPQEVLAAIGKLFPNLDPKTIEIFLSAEAKGAWTVRQPTVDDMAREIAFIKLSGMSLPPGELDPAAMVYP